ncbi:type II toxin-antitoxin system HicB family antitoxin [Rhodovulum sulfidophilum]|uniref:type II toxin-antitoxin system HicB family antitoxin n=1 Tax=Rhodovulum sulfidophilum TaxID=35806 RepID=UPI0019233582|nr:type II toxin-antitoxin system HicB family antitoxin [Rhodovulum sulfidophilum]MBL3562289.1 type II toxin-antitoxin system HicB family antitoxin [Rhodovulum sulfidophilum]
MLAYPIDLTPDDNGTLLVTCPDLPEVTSFSDTEAEVLRVAKGAISEALASRLSGFEDIPRPGQGLRRAAVPLQLQIKVLLFWALSDAGKSRADLVRDLGWHRPQVDRLFDPNHATRLEQYDAAFAALGQAPGFALEAAA